MTVFCFVFVFLWCVMMTATGSKTMSKLMMVDLAGSEKVGKTEATGQRLEEAKNINKSLMTLGVVINKLVEQSKFVPYRDSVLTRLLSDALGGNSKTCLIVTASPSEYNLEETISAMQFGQRAKKVINKAMVNAELSVEEYKKLLAKSKDREAELKRQIAKLKKQVKALQKALEVITTYYSIFLNCVFFCFFFGGLFVQRN